MKSGIKVLITLIAVAWATQSHASVPKISIEYSPTVDAICAFVKGGRIKDEWKTELVQRKVELEALWRNIGSTLISATEDITGGTFPEGEQTVRLTLCEVSSQSYLGISVNMRYALSSFTNEPVPLRYKVETIFHELLHKFMAKHHPKDTPLLKAHANEPERTRNHLHLLALQKAVLLKINASAELADVVRIDSQLPDGYYKRAWDIVNATDTEYLKYVAEIPKN
jgi:hypothetical protein